MESKELTYIDSAIYCIAIREKVEKLQRIAASRLNNRISAKNTMVSICVKRK